MKSATVSVIGRPSSGKSTLVNTICGMKVSITSPTPQTTRNKIRGIYTDTRGQLVFTDTPGYHLSDKEINRRMQDVTVSALKDSDLILYLVDGKRRKGKEEEAIARMISLSKVPTVVAINKLDILSEEDKKEAEESVKAALPSSPVLFLSAKEDQGVDEVLIELFRLAPDGLFQLEIGGTEKKTAYHHKAIDRRKAEGKHGIPKIEIGCTWHERSFYKAAVIECMQAHNHQHTNNAQKVKSKVAFLFHLRFTHLQKSLILFLVIADLLHSLRRPQIFAYFRI